MGVHTFQSYLLPLHHRAAPSPRLVLPGPGHSGRLTPKWLMLTRCVVVVVSDKHIPTFLHLSLHPTSLISSSLSHAFPLVFLNHYHCPVVVPWLASPCLSVFDPPPTSSHPPGQAARTLPSRDSIINSDPETQMAPNPTLLSVLPVTFRRSKS